MPSIFVAPAGEYSAGEWIDLAGSPDVDSVHLEIRKITADQGMPDDSRFAVMEWEGFGGVEFAEDEPIDRVVFLASLVNEFGEEPVAAFVTVVQGGRRTGFTSAEMRESYQGRHVSAADFVKYLVLSTGSGLRCLGNQQLVELADVIDWRVIAAQFEDRYDFVDSGDTVLVFERPRPAVVARTAPLELGADPDRLLELVRGLVQLTLSDDELGRVTSIEEAIRAAHIGLLASAFEELDRLLACGKPLPQAWKFSS